MSSDLENFVGLSSVLTGISTERLAPEIDQVGLPPLFLEFITPRVTPDVLSTLLTQYANLAGDNQSPDQIAQAVLMDGTRPADTQTAKAARSIMKLWLLGVWYQPYDAASFKKDEQTVVSDQAYINGWAWKAAQAHPMGYSEMFFGYWNTTPPSLEDYTGVPANTQQGASS